MENSEVFPIQFSEPQSPSAVDCSLTHVVISYSLFPIFSVRLPGMVQPKHTTWIWTWSQGLFGGRPKLRDPKYKATFLTEDWASFSSPLQALETYIRNPTWQLPSYSHSSVRLQCPWTQSPDAPHSAGGLSIASISGKSQNLVNKLLPSLDSWVLGKSRHESFISGLPISAYAAGLCHSWRTGCCEKSKQHFYFYG